MRWLTAGESHGPALVATVEGLPAGIQVTSSDIGDDLARRRLGYGRGARMKFERDEVELLGGLRHGVSLGGPVSIVVRNSGLDWTIVRPSGLFDIPEPTDYVCGPVDPVGAFTARIDLADYLISLVADAASVGRTVIVSTTQRTPTLWQMVRQEAVST